MAGLVPAIHDLRHTKQGVDARDKRGHDVERGVVSALRPLGYCIGENSAGRKMSDCMTVK
jgi:hypothetical protein